MSGRIYETVSDFAPHLIGGRRLMGMDLGTKTIGLALSDPGWIVASPWKTHIRGAWKKDAPLLAAMWKDRDVGGVIVGLPLQMDGRQGARCHAVRHFAVNLCALGDLPILLWDERLTTVAAERVLLKEADLSRARRGEVIDAVAASLILQGVLETLRLQKKSG